jgi:PAS domain S-box-containing protein
LQHLQNSEDWYGEYRWQHANGEWRWIEESVRKVEEAASELVWVGVWRDVTGKKNVELRLRERELLFNLTQHLAHVGSWSDNLQTGEIFWSDEMYRMYGYPPGKGDPATIPSRHLLLEDEQVFRDQYEESLRTSERFSQVLRLIRKDGEESTLRISWQCLWGDNGKPQRVIGTAQDITRQLAQERRLRESQMIFQQAFENAFDGFLLLNDRMQVVRVNRALRQMLNYEEEELVGRDPAVLLDADSYSEVMKSFELLATGESDGYRVERTYRAKDGTPIPVNVGASAMRREDGRLRLVIVHVQDQRSIQEAQTQLLHSAKLAAIGELTAGITHELKNPLGAILNTAEMLTDFHEMGIEFELVRHLETITSAVDRCNSIIEHMLRYTRKDELGSETKAPILLRQVLENTLMLMGASLRHNGIEVTTLLPEDPVRIWGDANALEQVVTNFVSNARDAMRESDQRRLLLKVWQEAEETVLRIQDTGCGMSEKVQARMIESFFTTKKAGRGTGLGMSISNMILKDHNARFTCRSQVGEGTTFDIYFPPLPAEGSALGQ